MIILKNLHKSYGNKVAVNNLNLTINDGEIFGFIGPNGAGKTTTIKMMVGILRQDKGEVLINNIDMLKNPIQAKKLIGYVPDTPDIYEKLTGIQYINFIADAYKTPHDVRKKNIERFAEIFELKDSLGDYISNYSHGMKQKVVLISTLVHEPKVWILDEPLVGLDPKAAFELKNMMREHANKGNIVFFSTHILDVAERLCDRVGIIKNGKVIACGTLDELRSGKDETLENIFMELTE
ncbi:ABC transporter ATP-binding protein [Caldicellulosiruptoraceae bacterium PP1]